MDISIASYSFHGCLEEGTIDVFGYMESLKYRYHRDAADIWSGMLKSTEEDYLKKVRTALDARGLYLANLCVDGPHLWEPDSDVREQHYRDALSYLRAAEILGARTIRIDMGGRELEMTEEQFEYTVKRYREYAHCAQENGYKVGTENHWGASRKLENIQRLYEAVDNSAFGILLHFENWESTDVDEADKFAAQYAFHTHLAAWVEPRYEQKIKYLRDAGYTGVLGVEHHSGKNEYIQVEWQLGSVRRALCELER